MSIEVSATGAPVPAVLEETLRYTPTSANEILAMLQTRLRDLDTQIGQIMNSMQTRADDASDIASRLQARRELQEYCRGMEFEDEGNIRWSQFDDDIVNGTSPPAFEADGVTERKDYTGTGPQIGQLEAGLVDRLRACGINPAEFNRDALNDSIQTLDGELQRVNAGNEMMMVKLQSLTQQRTSAVQMATNMLAAQDEGTDSIVGNLR